MPPTKPESEAMPVAPAANHLQDAVQQLSLDRPDLFWARQAERLAWHKTPDTTLRRSPEARSRDRWQWFPGGEISTCFNCLDRHVDAGLAHHVALYYDSPVTGSRQSFSYGQLLDQVEVLAAVLAAQGVRKGDVVMLYMPMIPAAVIGILAVNRLGAVHCVVFGGFASKALAQRIDDCRPLVLLTASCGIDGAKPPIAYRPLVEAALEMAAHRPASLLVWQRDQEPWKPLRADVGQVAWQDLVEAARDAGRRAGCVPVASDDPLYLIHTSGTTGAPKGVVREAAGHAVGLALSMPYLFDVRGPGDVVFTASDIGWVVGHSYIVYGPLLAGASTVLYEGKPVGTPDPSAFWRIVEQYQVRVMFTAPTALRAIRRDDPDNECLTRVGRRGGLRSLRALFLAGERSEPKLVAMYQQLVARYGAPSAQVVDNWWSTEAGSPITGRALAPRAAIDAHLVPAAARVVAEPPPIRPGSAGKPMPGFDVRVVDDAGHELPLGAMGNIVLALPLAPTAFRTLWNDDDRFYRSYLNRFHGRWLDTGDAGCIDRDGYVHVMSRNDDVLNVSAHRLSSGGIEQAVSAHALVAECCVIGIPDPLKGQRPFAFITLSTADHPTSAVPAPELAAEIQELVRSQVGAFAALGGIVQGKGIIPRTRSGKTLRRVLRQLVDNAVHDELDKEVTIPSTVEDAAVVDAARAKLREYFQQCGEAHGAPEDRRKGPKL